MQKKYYFLALIFFSCCFVLTGQHNIIDSLRTALRNAKHDTTRCIILNQLIESETDDKIWPLYNQELLKLARANAANGTKATTNFYLKQVATALSNIGFLSDSQGDIPKALEYFHEGLKIQEGIKDRNGMANSLDQIGLIYTNQGNIPKALEYNNKSLAIREELSDKEGIATLLNNIGTIYQNQGDISRALDHYHRSLKIQEEVDNKEGIARSLNNIATIHYNQGDITRSLEYYHKSLKINEEIQNKDGISNTLNNIGIIYELQNDFSTALKYYDKSLKIREETKDKKGIARSLNNIGHAYKNQGAAHKALEYYRRSLSVREEIQDKDGIATSLNNIGACFYDEVDSLDSVAHRSRLITTALDFYQRSLKIREEIEDKQGITNSLNNIAIAMCKNGDWQGAQKYAERSLKIARELAFPENIRFSAETLNRIYKRQNKFREALEMYELEVQMRDSIINKETKKAALKKQFQYDYEKKEAVADAEHKSEMEKQQAVADEQSRKQNIIIWSVVIGLLLVIVFSGFILRSLNIARKQKQIIELKNKETEEQKHLIEEKQKEIIDSITYAQRIQRSLLPTEKYMRKVLERA